ncbi:cell division protein DivIC [Lentibacillus halophilus]|uniref:Cell division protein DivIC n=1 Tax=Lentibacillus halophilus TaxID=295065 RepID=A0ABN0Z916_9BACI
MSADEKTVTHLDSDYMQQYDAYIARQKRKKKRLVRRLVLFAAITMLVIGSLTVYHLQQRSLHAEKQQQYEQLQDKLAHLEKKEQSLKEDIHLLNNDEYVLEIARTNYFYSKEGELIFNIPDKEPSY